MYISHESTSHTFFAIRTSNQYTATIIMLTCNPNSVIMFAPTLPALIGLGPLLPGSGGIRRESIGRSCDVDEDKVGRGLDLHIR